MDRETVKALIAFVIVLMIGCFVLGMYIGESLLAGSKVTTLYRNIAEYEEHFELDYKLTESAVLNPKTMLISINKIPSSKERIKALDYFKSYDKGYLADNYKWLKDFYSNTDYEFRKGELEWITADMVEHIPFEEDIVEENEVVKVKRKFNIQWKWIWIALGVVIFLLVRSLLDTHNLVNIVISAVYVFIWIKMITMIIF